ncbi:MULTISPECIES: alpha/beta hydrolase [Acinetobacter]|uniref:alpha/beta hydrolase n=1 Tax=Acinetobacter TaxID=469 RepID=UPI0003B2AD9C|nr:MULTISPECIES: alpha/beta hydrolase [Acinetobacter]MDH2635601.1 alpha/beta hydrolase [Acinetobacter nosocomialis]MDO7215992.1 alpha/beta hydrolase [Acinetobacter nosocomialis]MDO7218722.1 alpha/beta hydrolase [Acinetobacter nosocomialis]MDO7437019.1 alpha/beta hydrolase [Acinetobacter nosocomialis]MPS60164.1 alpha/beta hydrolase [Acinetobacter sp.]
MKSVKIKAPYWEIAANLYFPENFDESIQYPAIISGHPIGSCKEQTSGNVYGAALAKAGFIVIAFDASFQGESGGEPRSTENPVLRVEDFRLVTDYLMTLNYVDENRIGVLGICGGGGYALNVAMTEKRIKAVATVDAVNFGRLSREGFSNWNPLEKLELIAKQRTAEARGETRRIDDLLPSSVEEAKSAGITDIDVLEATDYYKTDRGYQPNGVAKTLFSHSAVAIGWDAFHLAEVLLTQPLLLITGDKVGGFGSYRDSLEIYGRARSQNKELVIVEGWSHYDLYDKPEPVAQALAKLIPFFQKNI